MPMALFSKPKLYEDGYKQGNETLYDSNGAVYLEVLYQNDEPVTFRLPEKNNKVIE